MYVSWVISKNGISAKVGVVEMRVLRSDKNQKL